MTETFELIELAQRFGQDPMTWCQRVQDSPGWHDTLVAYAAVQRQIEEQRRAAGMV